MIGREDEELVAATCFPAKCGIVDVGLAQPYFKASAIFGDVYGCVAYARTIFFVNRCPRNLVTAGADSLDL